MTLFQTGFSEAEGGTGTAGMKLRSDTGLPDHAQKVLQLVTD